MNKLIKYVGFCLGVASTSLLALGAAQKTDAKEGAKKIENSAVKKQCRSVYTVDIAKLFTIWTKAIDTEGSLKLAEKEAHAQVEKMIESGKNLFEKLEALQPKTQDLALSEEERNKSKTEFELLQTQLREKEIEINKMRLENDRKQAELYQKSLSELDAELKEKFPIYAKEHHVPMIFDSRSIVYCENQKDVTDDFANFLNQLDKDAKAKQAANSKTPTK